MAFPPETDQADVPKNIDHLRSYIEELEARRKKKLKDTIILVCIAILGISGLVYVLTVHPETEVLPASQYDLEATRPSVVEDSDSLSDQYEFSIVGERVANSPLEFRLFRQAGQPELYLDFGDGSRQVLNDESTLHTFTKPGTYRVRILTREGSEWVVLQTRPLVIHEEI